MISRVSGLHRSVKSSAQPFAIFMLVLCFAAFKHLDAAPDSAPAPPAVTASPSVADLVASMPADTIDAGARTADTILKLGPAGLKQVIGMLLPPGQGDDSHARTALNGIAWRVTRPGAEKERAVFSAAMISALKADSPAGIRPFLVALVQMVGREEAVAPLAGLLGDPDLCDPAARALLTISERSTAGLAVGAAILKALPAAQGRCRLSLIQALGQLRERSAVPALLLIAASDEAAERSAALDALANTGDPAATGVLTKAAQVTGRWERSHAVTNLLLFARRLSEGGRKAEASAICRDLLRTRAGENDTICDALAILVDVLGKDAERDVLAAADSGNKKIRAAALALTQRFPGQATTASLAAKMKTAGPGARSDLLYALRVRGDSTALSAILPALRDPEASVRLSAVDAATRFPTPACVSALLALDLSDEDEGKTVKAALLRLPGSVLDRPLKEALSKPLSPPTRVVLLQIVGIRRAAWGEDLLFKAAADADTGVRGSALQAMAKVADPKTLSRLIDLMLKTSDDSVRTGAQDAVVAVCRAIPDADHRQDLLLNSLSASTGANRILLLQTLARLGGPRSLQAVLNGARSTDDAEHQASVRLLAGWNDPAAAPDLLKAALAADGPARALALRGYIRLVGLLKDDPIPTIVADYRQALGVAASPDEKRLVLAGLSRLHESQALQLAGTLLDDPAVGGEAAVAALRIASPQKDGDQPLKGTDVALVIKRVATTAADWQVRNQAYTYIKKNLQPPAELDPNDLAQGNPVTATVGSQGSHALELAVDGDATDLDSSWWGEKWPASMTVDLKETQKVAVVHVFFYWDGDRYYQYTVEVSADGKTWTQVADRSKNTAPSTPQGDRIEFAPIDVRYVRLNILKNSANEAVHVVEVKVYAPGKEPRPSALASLAEKPDAEGFTPLFDGETLTGWFGSVGGYVAANGIIACIKELGGDLYTEQEFSDFVLRFDFRLTPGANNGIGIRAPGHGSATYLGMEIQVLDDSADMYKDLHAYQYHGSIYGVVPAERGHQKPVGEWNEEEITARGRRVTVKLNGAIIVDADLDEASKNGTIDHLAHPGLKSPKGHIGFLGHDALVEFRKIRIKDLSK